MLDPRQAILGLRSKHAEDKQNIVSSCTFSLTRRGILTIQATVESYTICKIQRKI